MKTNEAPEKIYLIRNIPTPTSLNTTNDCRDKYLPEWYEVREKDADIEYTRTDAFIDKAVDFINQRFYVGINNQITSKENYNSITELIKDFEQSVKGE